MATGFMGRVLATGLEHVRLPGGRDCIAPLPRAAVPAGAGAQQFDPAGIVGGISLSGVDAPVHDHGMPTALPGMRFPGRIDMPNEGGRLLRKRRH